MNRRTVLAGVAGAVGAGTLGAYGLGAFDDPPFTLSVYAADGDETDVTCDLPDGFLDEHPVVADLVAAVSDDPPDNFLEGIYTDISDLLTGDNREGLERRPISREQAAGLLSDLESHCETTGGLYDIQGDWYFISIKGEPHSHSGEGDDHSH